MDSEVKERLYKELMHILMLLEGNDRYEAMKELEYLINKLQYNQL
jgi:hypothetical protein